MLKSNLGDGRRFQKLALAVATAIGLSLGGQAHAAAPNVLFVVVDDLAAHMPGVKTPNLDALRAQGVSFERTYTQYPVCGQSRASFLTGMRPNSIGHQQNFERFRCTLPDVVTLPQHFKNQGYDSVRIGKLYHQNVPTGMGKPGPDDAASWSRTFNPLGKDHALAGQIVNHTPGEGLGMAMAYLKADVRDDELTDGVSVNDALSVLAENQNKDDPLFLAVGFYRPHVPEVVPARYFDLYSDKVLERIEKQLRTGQPFDDLLFAAKNSVVADMGTLPEHRREFLRAYYAAVSYMDAQLGRLVEGLKKTGAYDNTMIVFTADHGFMLGQHGLWEKTTLFEGAVNVPLVISAPQFRLQAKVVDKPVELLDVYPTVLELAGMAQNSANQGTSLVPLMQDPHAASWQKPAFSQIFGGRSVRTERYRYTEWGNAFGLGLLGVELYDYSLPDPESKNLVRDPAYRDVVASLHRQIEQVTPLQNGEVRETPFIQRPQGPAIPRGPRPAVKADPCQG
ncbi:sulfatase [Pseudomonas sp. BP8]|uniref:sulfatase n=1 Tax=Pseudomonas sp. BP8 TaxID=2817864 RepID=UPI001AE7A85F|nr:sulfatase [Pseudomonas sp. BP8]MBP2261551.1 arylsulfatase A-like enzyme [Pseudomonas sp. BP8]HDS1733460.1 sulfatase [Pseudomonas putida]